MSERLTCVGGAVVDRKYYLLQPAVAGTSNPARAVTGFGGVARNVAETLARLGLAVGLVSRVGDDEAGRSVLTHLAGLGVDTGGVAVVAGARTAQYVALLGTDRDLVLAAFAADGVDGLGPADVAAAWPTTPGAWVFLDCNLEEAVLADAIRRAAAGGVRLALDAVSAPKAARLPADLRGVAVLFCNGMEARAWARRHRPARGGEDDDEGLAEALVAAGAAAVVLSRGRAGSIIAGPTGTRRVPAAAADAVDVTGAGDALVAGTLAALARGDRLADAVRLGSVLAALTVETEDSVRADLTPDLLAAEAGRRPWLVHDQARDQQVEGIPVEGVPVGGIEKDDATVDDVDDIDDIDDVDSAPSRRTARRAPGSQALQAAAEVAAALSAGRPVVALESTIISHGMPYPDNLETALAVEDEVRRHGAVPATIALVDGRARIGLDRAGLERLARGAGVVKASRRDLAPLIAGGATAGTTVAATMHLAHRVGIPIFATGGIGGVHRGAETTFDVSADLQELGSTPVTVVCAGAKSILDLAKTLEMLETLGVPVIGYGTDEFPAFLHPAGGHPVDHRVDSVEQLAALISAHRAIGQRGGILVANPIDPDAALPAEELESTITEAVAEAERRGVTGKAVTPFLLARINELTGGASLAANIALIRGNAQLAARTAVALARAGRP